jgi:hypothetical protein
MHEKIYLYGHEINVDGIKGFAVDVNFIIFRDPSWREETSWNDYTKILNKYVKMMQTITE